jgi:zinc transport system substrate-binding protein
MIKRSAPRCFAVIVAGIALAFPSLASAAPRVVASIPPVHSLVAGVMDGIGTPELLVPATASAHTYSLRPSEARLLSQADLVFWIGPIYESFLEKPLTSLSSGAKIVRLADAPRVTILPARAGGPWAADAHDDHGHKPSPAATVDADGHVFLDPDNAKAIVNAAVDALATVDPANAARYRINGDAVTTRLDGLDAELRSMLAPVRERPFIVFHDAYQYVEKRYGLNAVGAITVSPERQPGARRLQQLRRKITQLKAVCVFAEPQFEPTLVQTVVERTQARTGVLDPLGASVPPGRDAYFELMRAMARSLAGCLQS